MLTQGRYRRLSPACGAGVFRKAWGPDLDKVDALVRNKLDPLLARAVLEALYRLRNSLNLNEMILALQSGNVAGVISLLSSAETEMAYGLVVPALQQAVYAGAELAAGRVRRVADAAQAAVGDGGDPGPVERAPATVSGSFEVPPATSTTAVSPVPVLTGATFVFDRLDPKLTDWLRMYSLSLIRQIDQDTRDGVRQILVDGMREGVNPKDMATRIKDTVGLTDRQAQAVTNFRRELETFHTRDTGGGYGLGNKPSRVNGTQVSVLDEDGNPVDGITERRLRDFRYDSQLQRALESGTPLKPEQIDRMVDGYQRKYLAYRARTIARTESIRALNAGIQDSWRQAVEKGVVDGGLLRRYWLVAKDERLCKVCRGIARENKDGVGMDEDFEVPDGDPIGSPPAHPNCRCSMFIGINEPGQDVGDDGE